MMRKNTLALAVATALVAASAAVAADEMTLYGRMQMSVGQLKNGTTGEKTTAVESHGSRFGIRGTSDLDNEIKAIYQLEFPVEADGDNLVGAITSIGQLNAAGSPSNANAQGITATRISTAGLKHDTYGEVKIGRIDTPAKMATAPLDLFAENYGDMGNIIEGDIHRVNNFIQYSNKFDKVTATAGYSTGYTSGTDTATTVGDGDRKAKSIGVTYIDGPIHLGAGFTDIEKGTPNVKTGTSPNAPATSAEARHASLGAGYTHKLGEVSNIRANVIMERVSAGTDATGAAAAVKDNNVVVGAAYKIDYNWTLKAQHGESKRKGDATAANNGKETFTALGVDYFLGKKTTLGLIMAQDKNPNKDNVTTDKNSFAGLNFVTDF